MIAGGALLLGGLIIFGLWYTRHPAIIDRGEGQRGRWGAIDRHSLGHLGGSFLVAAVVGFFDRPERGAVVSFVLWSGVEVAQKNPRDRKGGVAEVTDVVANFLGALLGGLAAHYARRAVGVP